MTPHMTSQHPCLRQLHPPPPRSLLRQRDTSAPVQVGDLLGVYNLCVYNIVCLWYISVLYQQHTWKAECTECTQEELWELFYQELFYQELFYHMLVCMGIQQHAPHNRVHTTATQPYPIRTPTRSGFRVQQQQWGHQASPQQLASAGE